MSKSSENVKRWRKLTKQRMVDSMGGKCQCCGYNSCIEALDFHHLDPKEKEMGFGSVGASPRSWGMIVNELRKCILVCRNCHAEIHYNQKAIPLDFSKFDESYASYKIEKRFVSKPNYPKWDSINLRELYKTKSMSEIASMLGVCLQTIRRQFKKQSIEIKPHSFKADRSLLEPYTKPAKVAEPKISQTNPEWRRRPNLKIRKVERPSQELLKELVWKKPLTELGKEFGVSDNSIRKWCKAYNIELPPNGYWVRIKSGYSHEEALVSQKVTRPERRLITIEATKQGYELVKKGYSYRDAATAIGFNHWTLQKAIERFKLEGHSEVESES